MGFLNYPFSNMSHYFQIAMLRLTEYKDLSAQTKLKNHVGKVNLRTKA